MTILYQVNVYNHNKISYNIDDIIEDILEIDNDFVNKYVEFFSKYSLIKYKVYL